MAVRPCSWQRSGWAMSLRQCCAVACSRKIQAFLTLKQRSHTKCAGGSWAGQSVYIAVIRKIYEPYRRAPYEQTLRANKRSCNRLSGLCRRIKKTVASGPASASCRAYVASNQAAAQRRRNLGLQEWPQRLLVWHPAWQRSQVTLQVTCICVRKMAPERRHELGLQQGPAAAIFRSLHRGRAPCGSQKCACRATAQ